MISDIKLFRSQKPGKFKASGSFLWDKTFQIRFTIIEGPRGLFVGLPGKYADKEDADGKKKWYSDVSIVRDDVKQEVERVILETYQGENTEQSEATLVVAQPVPVQRSNNTGSGRRLPF